MNVVILIDCILYLLEPLHESPASGPADHPVSQVGGWTAGWRLREKASEKVVKVVKVVKVIIFCQICYVLQGFL